MNLAEADPDGLLDGGLVRCDTPDRPSVPLQSQKKSS
jgi:hypothetical protein